MKLNLTRRIAVLAILMLCFGWVAFTDNGSQPAMARPCCEDCGGTGPLPEDAEDYCLSQCGTDKPCHDACVAQSVACWQVCIFCG